MWISNAPSCTVRSEWWKPSCAACLDGPLPPDVLLCYTAALTTVQRSRTKVRLRLRVPE